jgi:uncharacterized RDD family membrane protein YckC
MNATTTETALERLAAGERQDASAGELLDLADDAIEAATAARDADALERIVTLLDTPASHQRELAIAAARARAALATMPRPTSAVEIPPYASWRDRVGGFLLDWVVIAVVLIAFTIVASSEDLIVVAWLAGPPLYFAVQHAAYAQTIGKRAFGTVVTGLDGQAVRPVVAFARTLVQVLLLLVPLGIIADLLWPLWDERRQTLHDKAARTLVLHEHMR